MDLPAPLDAVDAALAEHFAQRPLRASVSFVGVDPIEVLRFEPIPGERAYLSLGMSRSPMSAADSSAMTADGPRAELMLHLRDEPDEYADVWRQLAVLAAAPAVEGVVYRAGMTVDLGRPLAAGSVCTGAVVVDVAGRRDRVGARAGRRAAAGPGDVDRVGLVPGARQSGAAGALGRARHRPARPRAPRRRSHLTRCRPAVVSAVWWSRGRHMITTVPTFARATWTTSRVDPLPGWSTGRPVSGSNAMKCLHSTDSWTYRSWQRVARHVGVTRSRAESTYFGCQISLATELGARG